MRCDCEDCAAAIQCPTQRGRERPRTLRRQMARGGDEHDGTEIEKQGRQRSASWFGRWRIAGASGSLGGHRLGDQLWRCGVVGKGGCGGNADDCATLACSSLSCRRPRQHVGAGVEFVLIRGRSWHASPISLCTCPALWQEGWLAVVCCCGCFRSGRSEACQGRTASSMCVVLARRREKVRAVAAAVFCSCRGFGLGRGEMANVKVVTAETWQRQNQHSSFRP